MRPALLALGLLALAAAPSRGGDFEAWGPVLATHELHALDGSTTTLEALRGEVTVVSFWASWCKPCRKELVELDGMTRRLEGDGVQVLAVSIDSDRRRAERFVQKQGLALPVYHDGPDGLARALDLPSLPCTVVVDRGGRVVRVERGGDAEAVKDLETTVRTLVQGRPSAAPEEAAG